MLAHPRAVELAELLIERGAESVRHAEPLQHVAAARTIPFWLDFLYSRSRQPATRNAGAAQDAWPANGMLDYLLGNAVSRNHLKRTRWLLERGAHATAPHFYSKRNLHTEALLGGFTELAQLLVDFGAQPEQPRRRSCVSSGVHERRSRDGTPPARGSSRIPSVSRTAVPSGGRDRVDVAEMLLELGVSPDVEHGGWTALHSAAHNNSVRVAKLLIERGATIDIRDKKYHSTPLGHAVWAGQHEMVDLLSGISRDVIALVRAGKVERLRTVLDAEPALDRRPRATAARHCTFCRRPRNAPSRSPSCCSATAWIRSSPMPMA